MGPFDKFKKTNKIDNQEVNFENNPNYIKIFDEFGRELFITKEQWRLNILTGQLQKDWDNADLLYNDIVTALQDEFFKDVDSASSRLMEIDNNLERCTTIRGIVLMKNGKLELAEKLYMNYISNQGESGVVLTNLAKVHYEKGNVEESEKVLRHSLEVDPNQDNALGWLMAIENEKGGQEAVIKLLKEYSKISTSWRPQLWLGRYALENREITQAKEFYKNILLRSDFSTDAMMMISGDLGRNGYLDEIVELIAPHYVPSKYGPLCGLNLLETYLQKKDWESGLKLIHQIRLENWVPFNERFKQYSNAFENIKKDQKPSEKISTPEQQITTISLDRPIWLYGLDDPEWLYTKKTNDALRIVFLPLSKISDIEENNAYLQYEDTIGRISRGLPLFLSEQLYFDFDCKPITYIFALPEKGAVLFGKELGWDFLSTIQNADIFITGEIFVIENEIRLHIWSAQNKEIIASMSEKVTNENLTDALYLINSSFQSEVRKLCNLKKDNSQEYYNVPTGELVYKYVDGLAQSLTLTLVENNFGKKEDLWGERNMYEWFLSLIFAQETSVIPRIMFVNGLAKGINFGSPVPTEFIKKFETLLEHEKDHSSHFYLLTPYLLKAFGKKFDYDQYTLNYLGIYKQDYLRWLEKIKVIN